MILTSKQITEVATECLSCAKVTAMDPFHIARMVGDICNLPWRDLEAIQAEIAKQTSKFGWYIRD